MSRNRHLRIAVILGVAGIAALGFECRSAQCQQLIDRGSRVQFSESWFDRTCFGQLTAAMARRRCNELLQKRVELADEVAELDQQQKDKLLVAGQVDIHRFFSTYDQLKREFEFGVISSKEWQERLKVVRTRSQPIVDQIQMGLNGSESLYGKTLAGRVDEESAIQIDAAYRRYARERYAAKIGQTLKQILRNGVNRKLSDNPEITVREGVTELLLASTEPPEFYGNSRNYIHTVVAKLVSVQGQLEDILNERELQMIENLYRMQHRVGVRVGRLERG